MPVDLPPLQPGRTGSASLIVGVEHTAKAVGSGALEVFASPVMIALMEAAAVDCLAGALPEGSTSLGIKLEVTHEAPTAIGARVDALAQIVSRDDRRIVFRVEARDSTGIIGRGTHERAVVETSRFLDRLRQRSEPTRG